MSQRESAYCSSKLYIWNDDLDPDRVSGLLGIEPDIAWRRGERKLVSDPEGRMKVIGDVHKRGCWCKATGPEDRRQDISVQLERWCECLSQRRAQLETLNAEGNEIYIDCYISHGPIVVVDLPAMLLARLGALGIGVKLNFYDVAGLFGDRS